MTIGGGGGNKRTTQPPHKQRCSPGASYLPLIFPPAGKRRRTGGMHGRIPPTQLPVLSRLRRTLPSRSNLHASHPTSKTHTSFVPLHTRNNYNHGNSNRPCRLNECNKRRLHYLSGGKTKTKKEKKNSYLVLLTSFSCRARE